MTQDRLADLGILTIANKIDKTVDIETLYYLVLFKVDGTVAPTKASYIIEKADILEVGSVCHVKDKSGIYEGIVVTYGSKDEVDNVEEQYLNGLYTPNFLVGLCDDSDDDDQDNDNKENEEPDRDFIEKEDVSRKRKTDGTAKLSNKAKKKSVPKKTKELKKVNDQKSTINLLGVSSIVSSGVSNFVSDTIVTSSVSTTSTTPVTVQSSCPITTSSVIPSSILDSSDSECQEVESHNGPNEEMLKS
ncbi:PREDICTED: uncharacterized protein LOC109580724 [Amphimedon queenslandica]|uniref:Uncharacterized protein n=1 Tax=Amphimedon queenslandica TaxID=400682 RepID=A0AAN0IYC5_AMPQE|nr:PREDICTED: uncharacterized protein LOC109580724 [Amphimedon queenslandica]|eukprot:XP_019849769.1 PREDICTED: uncharacterized protein LOC109580724 [Amphimedon queenslandica]